MSGWMESRKQLSERFLAKIIKDKKDVSGWNEDILNLYFMLSDDMLLIKIRNSQAMWEIFSKGHFKVFVCNTLTNFII